MKRSARFLMLDPKVPANVDADYIVIDVPLNQLRALIRQLEANAAFAETPQGKVALSASKRAPTCAIQMLVEASHPKTVMQGNRSLYPPSLLKDSIPRAGRS